MVDEELDSSAKSTLKGISTDRLVVHGFTVQTGGPEGQDKQRGKTARWELDGFMRHAQLELCAASKVADYMLVRFKDLPLQPALASAEKLLALLDQPFFMRHTKTKKPPEPYNDNTINNVLRGAGSREGLDCPGLQQRAGVEHVDGKLVHRIKHGAVRRHIDCLGSEEEARRYAKHSGKVHEASYSNRTWVPKLAMAKVAGHRDGFVQLYRAGIWCSIEQDAAFKGLFDRITPVTDAQLAEAERLMEGRNRWPGVRTTLVALRDYTDVILQDLVEWCAHPIMGPDYLAATDRFPFLAVKDRQHADWLRFCTASSAKAAALRNADGGGCSTSAPDTPTPAICATAVVRGAADTCTAAATCGTAATPPAVDRDARSGRLHQPHQGGARRPGRSTGGWTAAALYARYGEPLKAGVPSLKEIMVQQVGHSVC